MNIFIKKNRLPLISGLPRFRRSVLKTIFPRSQKRPETEGKYFSVRTNHNGINNLFIFSTQWLVQIDAKIPAMRTRIQISCVCYLISNMPRRRMLQKPLVFMYLLLFHSIQE